MHSYAIVRSSLRLSAFLCVAVSWTGCAAPATRDAPATQPAANRPDETPVVADNSRVVRDVAFVENAHAQQQLDIYAPIDARGAPVVMFVHGGEWTRHDKSEVASKPRFFNENGVVFISVNYRLSGVAKHPAQLDDVAAAVRWTRDHVAEYGGDPEKIVLMGHSAGCHLVTLAGLDPRPLAKVKLTPADVRGVVSWGGGAFDLVQKVKDGGMYAGYIRTTFGDDERAWHDASPMTHVGESKPMPRFLFASAEKDKPASIEASNRMTTMIQDAGGAAVRVMLPGKDHRSANHDVGQPGDGSGEVLLRFIRQATDGGAQNAD